MTIGVLILNFNGAKWLPGIFEAVSLQKDIYLSIYLIDNASTDESISLTLERYPEVKIVRFSQNMGYSMAYNVATNIAFANGCEIVVWANNDIKLAPDCVRIMTEALAQSSQNGIVGPAFLEWSGDEPNQFIQEAIPEAVKVISDRRATPLPVTWVEGSFLMIRKQCFEQVGPLDPDFFFYWEEADYCRRAKYHGWRVVLAPTAIARHYGGGSTENPSHRDRFLRLKTRNEYIYRGTDPTRSWLRNLLSIAHLAAIKLKAGVLGRNTTLTFEMVSMFDAFSQLVAMHRKWRRDRNHVPPQSSTGAIPIEYKVLSKEGFAE